MQNAFIGILSENIVISQEFVFSGFRELQHELLFIFEAIPEGIQKRALNVHILPWRNLDFWPPDTYKNIKEKQCQWRACYFSKNFHCQLLQIIVQLIKGDIWNLILFI